MQAQQGMMQLCLRILLLCWGIQIAWAKALPLLIEATLDDLQAGLESGDFTSVDLVRAYSARIMEVNSTLRMVTELNPDALQIATSLDGERSKGSVRGPLHGIPILIKNNIATDDKMNNTAGSFVLLGSKVPEDSTIAKKLRQAGAIILGKSNLSQWANFRSDNSSNGWSAYGGQVTGAYYPKQDPSGSSSGSGVSSSIGLALASLGTETDGSILSPSEKNNLAGIKPSVGLTSRYLVIPISQHQDTIGPMARTVKDAAYLLSAIAGEDSKDNYTSVIPNKGKIPDYVGACKFDALEGARIGVPENVLEAFAPGDQGPQMQAYRAAITTLQNAGATIVPNANFTKLQEFESSPDSIKILNADFITDLKEYLSKLTVNPYKVHNLQRLTSLTKKIPAEDYPSRDVGVWEAALKQGYGNKDPRFWEAYTKLTALGTEGGVIGAIQRHDLDAVVLPTAFAPNFAAVIGSPVVTVPLGFLPADEKVQMNARGNLVEKGPRIPFGFSFLGERFSEEKLVGLAYAFEQRTMVRDKVKPYIVPNIELKDVMSQSGKSVKFRGRKLH